MRKWIMIIGVTVLTSLILSVFLFVMMNSNFKEELTDGIQINATFIDIETSIISDIEVEGELIKPRQITEKIQLEQHNEVSITNQGAPFKITFKDIQGGVKSIKVDEDTKYDFNADAGVGRMIVDLEKGAVSFTIKINEESLEDE